MVVRGIGIHGGRSAVVRLFRSEGPIRFVQNGRRLLPTVEAVIATRGATTLGGNGMRIAMVEHLLAALQVRNIWSGLTIEVEGDELPILDGSAAPWDEALTQLGSFAAAPDALEATAAVEGDDGATASLEPGARSLDASIAFDHPAIGRQRWTGGPERWHELLAARTFGFAAHTEALRAAGLARGATAQNAIVFGDHAPTRPLRFPDEPVRHKALDALGDLYLLGRPFSGRLRVDRAGHDLHGRLVRRLTGYAAIRNPSE